MMYFKRKKIKLSLIDDYIKILFIKNFYNNSFDKTSLDNENYNILQKSKQLNLKLDDIYNQLFTKLNLQDLSLMVLKKELKNNNYLYLKEEQNSFLTLKETIEKNNLILNNILSNLKEKLKILKLDLNLSSF